MAQNNANFIPAGERTEQIVPTLDFAQEQADMSFRQPERMSPLHDLSSNTVEQDTPAEEDDMVNCGLTSPPEPHMETHDKTNSGSRIINDTPLAIKNKMTATAQTLNTVQMSKSVDVFKIFDTAHVLERSPGFVTDR